MKVITAPEYYVLRGHETGVFLAGGITNCRDWQSKVIKRLDVDYQYLEDLVIFNPRRENFPIYDPYAAYEQIEWEYHSIEKCDIFSMYFASGDSDQPICMYELGRNILRMQMKYPADWEDRIIISVEDGYRRKEDVLIQTELATDSKLVVNTDEKDNMCLFNHIENIVKAYKNIDLRKATKGYKNRSRKSR